MYLASRLSVVIRSFTAVQLLLPPRIKSPKTESLFIGSLVCSGNLPTPDKFLLVDVSYTVKTCTEPCYNPLVLIDAFLSNVKKIKLIQLSQY